MLDITLRPLKDNFFDPVSGSIPAFISPLHITAFALLAGIGSCYFATLNNSPLSVSLWLLNRVLDCLDGAVARHRKQSSDLGGFLDLLSDFIIYSAIPICCTLSYNATFSAPSVQRRWLAVAIAEATFHVNNFVLFYVAAVVETKKAEKAKSVAKGAYSRKESQKTKELTSVSMRPALVEGAESGVIFTLMLALPRWTEVLCWVLAAGVVIGTMQRVWWTVGALKEG